MKFDKVLSIVLAILTYCSYPCCASNGIGKLDGKFGMVKDRGSVGRRLHVFNGRNTKKIGLGVKKQLDNSSVNVKNLALGLFYVGVPLFVGIGLIVADIKGSGNSVHVVSADQLCHTGNGAKFVKGKYICGGVQGSVYRCTFNGDNNYVLKEIDFHATDRHNPVVSEMLACDELKGLKYEQISKPVYYVREAERKAKIVYKFANGEKIGNSGLQKKIENLDGLSRKKLLVSIVNQLLGVVDLLHNEYGIAHGDMGDRNYLIHIDGEKASVKVVDFGSCYKLKNVYVESDALKMCHPMVSVMNFLVGIYNLFLSFLGKDEAIKFYKYVVCEVSSSLRSLVESTLIYDNRPIFKWREKHINEILKVSTNECDTVIERVREYIDEIK